MTVISLDRGASPVTPERLIITDGRPFRGSTDCPIKYFEHALSAHKGQGRISPRNTSLCWLELPPTNKPTTYTIFISHSDNFQPNF